MVININPNRINIAPGVAGKAARDPRAQTESAARSVTPRRAAENIIPSPESLRTLVTAAVDALRRGVRWDRGTILNVVA
jgi:hypothetical protein